MGNCFTVVSRPSCLAFYHASTSSGLTSSPTGHRFSSQSLPYTDFSHFYDLGPHLGRGQFGVIRRCVERSTGVVLACKSIPKCRIFSAQELDNVLQEIDILQHLSGHPHVVRLHHAFQDTAYVHLVMELCEGGELFDRITKKERYSEREAAALIKGLVETVKFCHSMGVMHRDLKPENILLADSSESSGIKLADFGLSLRFSPGEKFSGMAGSAYYIAPEVLQGQYSEEIDVWSAGIILYVLLCGIPPFWADTDQGILDAIKRGNLQFSSDPWGKISRSAKNLIRGMLCPDPSGRLNPTQVLEHPWIIRYSQVAQTQNSQRPRAPRELVGHDQVSLESSFSRKRRPPQESSSSSSPIRGSSVAAASDETEGFTSHRPRQQLGHGQPSSGESCSGDCRAPQEAASCSPGPNTCAAVVSNGQEGFSSQTSTQCDQPVSHVIPVSSVSSVLRPDSVESTLGDLSICASCAAAQPQSPKLLATNVLDKSNVSEEDFSDFFAAVIDSVNRLPVSSLCTFTPMKVKYGCTCTLMQTSPKEQTYLIEMRHGKFLLVHDKSGKRIGWKRLQKKQDCSATSRSSKYSRVSVNRNLLQQFQVVC